MSRRVAAVLAAALAAAACGRKDESIAERAGSKMSETVTHLAKGVDAGIDRGKAIPVEASPALVVAGVTATVSKTDGASVSVYLVSKLPLALPVIVRALNRDDAEIGRAKADVTFTANDGKYVALEFPAEMDRSLVAKYVVEDGR
jgi:hypothetical protein